MTNDTIAPRRLPTRRAVVAASAWTAPAILLTVASPAHAASTDLGLITFVGEQVDVVGAGAVQTYTMQLTVPEGRTVPAYVTVGYRTSGIVDGPLTVPTGGQTVFSFDVTALAAEGSTEIEVGASGFVPAKTALRVITDYSALRFTHGSGYGSKHKDDLSQSVGTTAPGTTAIYYMGNRWGDLVATDRNRLLFSGFAEVDSAKGWKFPAGPLDYRLHVLRGGEGLSWASTIAAPNGGRPIKGTIIDGTAHFLGGITTGLEYPSTYPQGGNRLLPIVRDTNGTGRDSVWFRLTFPRFPEFVAIINVDY
jgi:hypothetical protein